MEYLIQCTTLIEGGEVFNFIFDEAKVKQFLRMAWTHLDAVKITRLGADLSQKELQVNFVNKTGGGYVSDRFGNLEFNF